MRRIGTMLAAMVLLIAGCRSAADKSEQTGFALDTVVSVTVYGETAAAQTALDASFAELERLEALLSATREGSDVDRINQAGGAPVTVAEETAQLLILSQQVAALSGGAFDVTIRPVSVLWDFSADKPSVPDTAALAAACALVDHRQLTVAGTTVTLTAGGIELGGVAKGYIADRLRDVLTRQGVTSALIDLGGNIVAVGDKAGEPFRIGIKDPADVSSLCAIVNVSDLSVVTSGSYERGFTLEGVRYHHLLDPKTGMPVQNGLASVTILAQSSALADALSTACFVLGESGARQLLAEYPGTQALFVYDDGTMTLTEGLTVREGSSPPEITLTI